MAIIEVLAKEVAQKLGGKAVGALGIPFLGEGIAAIMLLKKTTDKMEEEVRDKARTILRCKHIEVCPTGTGATQITNMVNFVAGDKAMAFRFDSVALCHQQPNFDVKVLSTEVYRWDGQYVSSGSAGLHIQPCLICSRK
jgi:hypothetical protein